MSSSHLAQEAAMRAERHIAMLQKLAELSMQLAARAAQEALCQAPPAQGSGRKSGTDPHTMFDRFSRSVRETIALKARIAAGCGAATGEDGAQADARLLAALDWLRAEIASAHHQGSTATSGGEPGLQGPSLH